MFIALVFNPGYVLHMLQQPAHAQHKLAAPISQTESFPIILYHHIRPITSDMSQLAQGLSVTPDAFEAQLLYLKSSGYQSMRLSDFATNLSHGKMPDKYSFALTFDDGYQDFYTYAWPLLKRYGFHATLFVIINRVGTPDYVTWDQIKELNRSGLVAIESHTLNHPMLGKLPSNKARYEIEQSKSILEQKLGHPISIFCYPYGNYTPEIATLVQQAGYTAAVSTKGGVLHSRHSLFELRRMRLSTSDTGSVLKRKISYLFGQKTP